MATSTSPKVKKRNAWIEVINSSRKKANTTPKVELEKRSIIFHQEDLLPQKLEADLMLALNKPL